MKVNKKLKKMVTMIVLLLLISAPINVFARAGGGGGGHSGGSSSHSSSSSSGRGGYSNSNEPKSLLDKIKSVLIVVGFSLVARWKKIIAAMKRRYLGVEVRASLKKLKKEHAHCDWKRVKLDIKEDFYKIQDAWTKRDQEISKEYMSEYLYESHKTQCSWMRIKNEINILEGMKIKSITPMSLEVGQGEKDSIVVCISAKAKDYIIKESTGEVLRGNYRIRESFNEYWRFVWNNQRWIADEITQVDEIIDEDS